MKARLLFTTFLLTLCYSPLFAQDKLTGIISYEQVVDYGIEPNGNPRRDAMIADLPKMGKAYHTLTFNEKYARYEEDMDLKEPIDPDLEKMLAFMRFRKLPEEEVIQVFYDFEKDQRTEVLEFMTRSFILNHPITSSNWKISGGKKQVGEFVCFEAKLASDENIIAWFSPELPLPAGPGQYSGLPGIILAIEQNNEIVLMATEIILEDHHVAFEEPKDGKRVTDEEFSLIKEEKTAEFIEQREQRRQQRGQQGRPPQGGRKAN